MDAVRDYAGLTPNDRNEATTDSIDHAACEPGPKFGSELYIWNVGKTIHDLMTLAFRGNFDEMMDAIEATEDSDEDLDPEDFITRAENAILGDRFGEFSDELKAQVRESLIVRTDEVYSEKLQTLLRQCLHVHMSRRPSPDRLFDLTQEGLEYSRARSSDGEDAVPERLCYRDNEINEMPSGKYEFKYHEGSYDMLLKPVYWDVEWPGLRPPQNYLDLARRLEDEDWQLVIPFRRPRMLENDRWFPRPPLRARQGESKGRP